MTRDAFITPVIRHPYRIVGGLWRPAELCLSGSVPGSEYVLTTGPDAKGKSVTLKSIKNVQPMEKINVKKDSGGKLKKALDKVVKNLPANAR